MSTTTDRQTKPHTSRKARHISVGLEDYHLKLPEWSRSQLETLRESPPLFYGRHIAKTYPPKWSLGFDDGSVAHYALTSPGGLSDVVVTIPRTVLNSQGHRKGHAWSEWSEANAGKIQMKEGALESIKAMIRNVYAHDEAGRLLSAAMHYEHTLLYVDEETGLGLRARLDLIAGRDGRAVIVDYKTTKCVTPKQFAWDAFDYGYHRQMAWYWDAVELFGLDVADFVFITSDKSPAHQCRCYRLPRTALELGRRENREGRLNLARRLKEDDWSDPLGSGIHDVDLPEKAYSPVVVTMGGVPVKM
jgi:RecB family exonuclease